MTWRRGQGQLAVRERAKAWAAGPRSRWLSAGRTDGQIASELGLAEKTVKNDVSGILAKLEVARGAEAAAYLARHTTHPGS